MKLGFVSKHLPSVFGRGSWVALVGLLIGTLCIGTLSASVFASPASAQPLTGRSNSAAALSVQVAPDLDEGRYRFTLSVASSDPSTEVVIDRRLLSFVIHPEDSRRRFRCSHPERPRVVSPARIRPGRSEPTVEWFDLRMYCWGRALQALNNPAEIHVHYGFRGRGRHSWIIRTSSSAPTPRSARARGGVSRIEASPIDWAGTPQPSEPPVVRLRPVDASTEAGVNFRVSIVPSESTRVYLRDDLFRFRVSGPTGEALCEVPMTRIVPIIDFYRRVSPRRGASTSLSAAFYCDHAFPVAGIYEVIPEVTLPYDGERHHIDAMTGVFQGTPIPFRIRRGNHGYVEQAPGEKLLDQL